MEIEVKEKFALKNLTSFKIGGVAEKVWFPKNQTELIYLLKNLKNPLVFGSCSDVLISSKGISQDIISTSGMQSFEVRGNRVTVDCGVKGPRISKEMTDRGLSGFEFMIGFPGSIGGNLFMNASAHGQCISDCLVEACVFDLKKQELRMLKKEEMGFAYRYSNLHKLPYVLISAEFEMKKSTTTAVKELVDRNLEFRKNHQPSMATPNAGSVFKNPEHDSAGRLLDKAGVKSFCVGGAKIWENHANFIVNSNDATSQDVLELMLLMYKAVKDNYTIELEPEVKFFGIQSDREKEICKILYRK